jgi:hypothetical protein
MDEERKSYKSLVENPQGKRSLGIKWRVTIKRILKETGYEDVVKWAKVDRKMEDRVQ